MQCLDSLAIVIYFLALLCISYGELDDSDLYPIIINTEGDKAVFIIPDVGCHVIQDFRHVHREAWMFQRHVYRTDGKTVDNIIDLCELYQSDRINATQFVVGIRERAFLIYPVCCKGFCNVGTHWCGAGNDAANETDLGYYSETDKCCREHDSCKDFIEGWSCHSTIPELCNHTPFTRSHCNCDQKFRACLQRANDTASTHIGLLYFTVFGLKCYREDYPILGCEEYGGFLNIHCQRYELDMTKGKKFQFFDSPKFSRGHVINPNVDTEDKFAKHLFYMNMQSKNSV